MQAILKNLVNEFGNIPRRGVVTKFSDLEVIALSLTVEAMSINSENCLFVRLQTCKNEFKILYQDTNIIFVVN